MGRIGSLKKGDNDKSTLVGACFFVFTTSCVVGCRYTRGLGIRGGCRRASLGGRASRVGLDNRGGRNRCGSGGSRRNCGCVLRGRCAMGGTRGGGGCSRGRSSDCRWC